VGGSPAVKESYVVAIQYVRLNGDRELCSGTLIGPRHVLTAGHCGCGIPETYRVSLLPDVRTHDWSGDIKIVGAPYVFDPSVCSGILWRGNDLAVLKLAAEIQISQGFFQYGYPTRLAWDLRSLMTPPAKLAALGFGYTEQGGLGVRMKAEIPVLTPDCVDARFAGICSPFLEMVLAGSNGQGGVGPRDTCGGDSGGPVLLTMPDTDADAGLVMLVGVTSRAAPGLPQDPTHQCGGGGVYTHIGRQSVHTWLDSIGVPKLRTKTRPSSEDLPAAGTRSH